MECQFTNRFRSFEKSLSNLKMSRGADPKETFVLPGTVQNYSLTFDLSWKVIKELLGNYYGIADFATGSPRQVLRQAFAVGLIHNDLWMQMLNVRNKLVHDYDGEIATKYFYDIVGEFTDLFSELLMTIKELDDLAI